MSFRACGVLVMWESWGKMVQGHCKWLHPEIKAGVSTSGGDTPTPLSVPSGKNTTELTLWVRP